MTTTTTPDKITPLQLRCIWGQILPRLARVVGNQEHAEQILREIVREISGQPSTRALTIAQANAVMIRLNGAAQVEKSLVTPRGPRRPGTGSQEWLARKLARDLWWDDCKGQGRRPGDPRTPDQILLDRFTGFVKRILKGQPWPTTRSSWNNVIEALAAIYIRERAADLPPRILAIRQAIDAGRINLTAWESRFFADFIIHQQEKGAPRSPGALHKFLELEAKYLSEPQS